MVCHYFISELLVKNEFGVSLDFNWPQMNSEVIMQLNAENLESVGKFFDTNNVLVTDRAILYVIDDIHYRIDEDGCWYFSDDPRYMGWAACNPPDALKGML